MIKRIKEILIMALMMSISFSVSAGDGSAGDTPLSDYNIIKQGLEDEGGVPQAELAWYIAAQEAALMQVAVDSLNEAYDQFRQLKTSERRPKNTLKNRQQASLAYIESVALSDSEKNAVKKAVKRFYEKSFNLVKDRNQKKITKEERNKQLQKLRKNKEGNINLVLDEPNGPQDKIIVLYKEKDLLLGNVIGVNVGSSKGVDVTFQYSFKDQPVEPICNQVMNICYNQVNSGVQATQFTDQNAINATAASINIPK